MNEKLKENQKLIVSIVKKGKAKKLCEATKKVGAEGGTTIFGRGTSLKEFKKIFGIALDEEREVMLTLVKDEIVEDVFREIITKGDLNKPGQGITFVIDVKKVEGVVHLLRNC